MRRNGTLALAVRSRHRPRRRAGRQPNDWLTDGKEHRRIRRTDNPCSLVSVSHDRRCSHTTQIVSHNSMAQHSRNQRLSQDDGRWTMDHGPSSTVCRPWSIVHRHHAPPHFEPRPTFPHTTQILWSGSAPHLHSELVGGLTSSGGVSGPVQRSMNVSNSRKSCT